MPDANSKASSSAIMTNQATGVPRNSSDSGKSGKVGPSRPWVPLVIFRSVASTVRTSVKTKVVIAKYSPLTRSDVAPIKIPASADDENDRQQIKRIYLIVGSRDRRQISADGKKPGLAE